MRIGVIPAILIFILTMVTQSCTVKKRVYRPGYFIVWNKRSKTSGNESKTETAGRIEPKSGTHKKSKSKDKPSATTPTATSEKEQSLTEYTEQVKKQKNKKPATKDVNTNTGPKKQ